jgi:two-component system response regulator RegA
MSTIAATANPSGLRPPLLLVDDDKTFCQVLKSALKKRGFSVNVAHNVNEALRLAAKQPHTHAVVDLRMPGASGLELVAKMCKDDPEIKLVVLTGYASISTAVEAIKLGATHYLTKPVDADEIVEAFGRNEGDATAPPSPEMISLNSLEWEHIQRALSDSGGNVSAAARRLGMHRRTLQRKLSRHAQGPE